MNTRPEALNFAQGLEHLQNRRYLLFLVIGEEIEHILFTYSIGTNFFLHLVDIQLIKKFHVGMELQGSLLLTQKKPVIEPGPELPELRSDRYSPYIY